MREKAVKWLLHAAALALGLAVIFALIHHVGFRRFGDILMNASPLWLVVAVLLYASSWIFRTWRLRELVVPSGVFIPPRRLFQIHIAGYALNSVLPVKMGDVATMVYLKGLGINIGRAAAIVVQIRLLDLLGLVLLFLPTFALALEKGFPRWALPSYLVCIGIAALPILIVMVDRSQRISDLLRRAEEYLGQGFASLLARKTKDVYIGYHEMAANKGILAATAMLSVVVWLVEVLTCWAVAKALGQSVSFLVVILAVAIGNIGKGAPATPGGVGVYEGLVAATMTFFGFPFDLAVVIAILDHLIKKGFNLMLGLPMAASVGVSFKTLLRMDAKQDLAG